MDTVRAEEMGKRAAMTVKGLLCDFDQHLPIGEQCNEGVPRHFRRIDPHEANRFAGLKKQRIAVNKIGDLTEPPFSLGNNLGGTE
jgi:hypothetical protein